MFNRILVPLDGSTFSSQVLPYVRDIAQGLQAQVTLVSVRPSERRPAGGGVAKERNESIGQLVERLSAFGVRAAAQELAGRPADAIIELTNNGEFDLVAMATHGRSGLRRIFRGSMATEILRRTSTPLLVVSPWGSINLDVTRSVTSVLVPLNGSRLSESALEPAEQLAKAMRVSVRLLRVLPLLPAVGKTVRDEQLVKQEAERYLESHKQALAAKGIVATVGVRVAWEPRAIIEAAREDAGTLIVMGSRGLVGNARSVLGSVADEVVRESRQPVLMIRPDVVT
ncbi:MAG: universal stress protein [Chloroflexi bacterium]|nr:universal stress protein [Chloroflexota bacterium]